MAWHSFFTNLSTPAQWGIVAGILVFIAGLAVLIAWLAGAFDSDSVASVSVTVSETPTSPVPTPSPCDVFLLEQAILPAEVNNAYLLKNAVLSADAALMLVQATETMAGTSAELSVWSYNEISQLYEKEYVKTGVPFGDVQYASMREDGLRAAIGAGLFAVSEGLVTVFYRSTISTDLFTNSQTINPPAAGGQNFGLSVQFPEFDDTMDSLFVSQLKVGTGVGNENGAVYEYKNIGTTPILHQTIEAADKTDGDGFGAEIFVYGNQWMIVSANVSNQVYVYERNAGTQMWVPSGLPFTHTDTMTEGQGLYISSDGKMAVVGSGGFNSLTGRVELYTRDNTSSNFTLVETIVEPDDPHTFSAFGTGIAVSLDEKYIIISGHGRVGGSQPRAYLYALDVDAQTLGPLIQTISSGVTLPEPVTGVVFSFSRISLRQRGVDEEYVFTAPVEDPVVTVAQVFTGCPDNIS